MNNYSSVIIDFDGTLFDTRRAISSTLYETFAAYNVPPPSPERVEALIGRGVNLEETLTHLMPQSMPAAQLDECVLTYRRIYNAGTGIRASMPFSGSRDALAELHAAGVPVVIASNKGEASVHAILTHFGMHDFVHLVIAARDACPSNQIRAATSSASRRCSALQRANVCSSPAIPISTYSTPVALEPRRVGPPTGTGTQMNANCCIPNSLPQTLTK